MSRHVNVLSCLVACFGVASGADDVPRTTSNVVHLDQGWTADERIQFYFTSQGSQLIPYDWFLALEQPDESKPFSDDANLERLRFIPHPKDPQRNPDGLPIGFVRDDKPRTVDYIVKKSYLGEDYEQQNFPPSSVWLGLTCAACHTTELHQEGKSVRIDGGPALADAERFLKELTTSLEATWKDPPRMTRFAKRVLNETPYNQTEEKALQQRVAAYSKVLRQLVHRSEGTSPYGFGRLDAFGAILNEICETSLELPENHFPADAPASYPFLWDTPRLDWVQWNGSIGNPMARNVGEVLGVFGQFRLLPNPPEERFRSTAHIGNLFELEQHVMKLKAPAWPAIFGKIDPVKAAAGEKLFAANCVSCHSRPDATSGKFPTVKINDREYIRTEMIALDKIGTDPKLVDNFMTRFAKPGALAQQLPMAWMGKEKVPRAVLLTLAVKGVIGKYVQENRLSLDLVDAFSGHRLNDPEPPNVRAYKARPLNGIWATAPYLHNGSVPNLYELLLPSAMRSKSFHVGSREFDAKRVGFVTNAAPGTFEFKVANDQGAIAGNSNAGHEGHGAGSKLGFTETFENGTWREFTDDERWALVEYMKSLGGETEDAAPETEQIPTAESAQIEGVVAATIQQLKNRYPGQKQILRGVHAKDHGCVKAVFEVDASLAPEYRVGVFREPGRRYDAWIRFSNAATLVLPDDPKNKDGKPTPGSRGMAIKLLGVDGTPLIAPHGALTQDFLMVNHPVFAFANVEDYQVLSSVVADPANREQPDKFFGIQFAKGGAAAERAKRTLEIVGKIRAPNVAGGAYQPQPASPVDCRYFSGAPFLFGDGYVMKFSAVPVEMPTDPQPNVADPNYLRNALIERLAVRGDARPVVFKFQVQRRPGRELDVARDIENASTEWPESEYGFVTVATITIPPQDFDSPQRRATCERLIFSPWHGVVEHRPLGGINRMRRAVYEASAGFRSLPKEPNGR